MLRPPFTEVNQHWAALVLGWYLLSGILDDFDENKLQKYKSNLQTLFFWFWGEGRHLTLTSVSRCIHFRVCA